MDKNFPIISPHRRREAEQEEELLRKEKLKWVSHHFFFVLMASVHPHTGDELDQLFLTLRTSDTTYCLFGRYTM